MNKTKTILITGGAGFIGSNLCDYFVGEGYNVVVLDSLITGNFQNISHLSAKDSFRFFKGDICNIEDCLVATTGVDVILHQAALGSVERSVKFPEMTNETNVSGFINVLNAALKNGVKRVVFASSSSVYGDSNIFPRVEEQTGNPLSPYAVSKVANELYGRVFSQLHGIEVIGLRYFNVFGPRQNIKGEYAAVIPKFIKAFLERNAPVINGNGEQTRDYTYITNVIEANRLALDYQFQSETKFAVFNVAFGKPTSVNTLYTLIKSAFIHKGYDVQNIQPVFGPARKGDVEHSFANIDKIKREMNYKPLIDLETGIKETIDWFINNT